MTSLDVDIGDLPPLTVFLGSVSPGIDKLEDNIHFLHDNEFEHKSKSSNFIWPLIENNSIEDSNLNNSLVATLHPQYLNIARPPLNNNGIYESNTYVSLPFHITNLFDKVIEHKTPNKSVDGGFQIGANVGSLMPDPFEYVHLNPGCLSEILELDNLDRSNNTFDNNDNKNPFTKLTNNFNKLLKLNHSNNSVDNFNNFKNFQDLPSTISKSTVFEKFLTYDNDVYHKNLNSVDTSKILVSCNINVLNLITIDNDNNYRNPTTFQSSKPYTSLLEMETEEPKSYSKTIEVPILRLQLKENYIITTMKVFKSHKTPFVVMGLNSGEIILINLNNLSFVHINNFVNDISKSSISLNTTIGSNSVSPTIINESVTSLEIINNSIYEFLIVAGYSNGEIILLNPFVNDDISKTHYLKTVVDNDRFVTYFKKFDLSPFVNKKLLEQKSSSNINPFRTSEEFDDETPNVVVGHLKISHKPITCITSTISLVNPSTSLSFNPLLIAVGGDDGLIKLMNLSLTYNCNYGNNNASKSIISDVISNYFQDGIKDLTFSNDFKILSVVGNGDLIELFNLRYYNVNSLLNQKKLEPVSSGSTKRSRSGTVNSTNSTSNNNNNITTNALSLFLSPSVSSPSTSLEINRHNDDNNDVLYPPSVKDIKLLCRLKSHSNIVSKIMFIKNDQVINKGFENKDSNTFYRLVSCGNDGRVIFWEFDIKGLPKIKKTLIPKKRSKKKKLKGHTKSKSMNFDESLNLPSQANNSVSNMNNLLNQSHSKSNSHINLNDLTDQVKGITGLYQSLYESRFKRHYNKLLVEQHKIDEGKFNTIIHPIINDKLVPAIEIPLTSVDFTCWFKDGKISNIYIDNGNFWCMGKNGDIIRYVIE
ncbi:hypothetical protein CLIB1444_15S01442 [[Candida] jaroonii]|uniref:Uncharacterized protein n=1 Tax=[Candida] jaroonii TaxID=467808 RepID=A0ACA9YEE7_9ASCO|nr:hypothetical protein CLIB1444_15S01442 [[Candida] jaroonii]